MFRTHWFIGALGPRTRSYVHDRPWPGLRLDPLGRGIVGEGQAWLAVQRLEHLGGLAAGHAGRLPTRWTGTAQLADQEFTGRGHGAASRGGLVQRVFAVARARCLMSELDNTAGVVPEG